MTPITKQQLQDAVTKIVTEHPDGYNQYGCVYVNPKNPVEPGCLFGHALLALGVPPTAFADMDDYYADYAGVGRNTAVITRLDGGLLTDEAAEWADPIQRWLDRVDEPEERTWAAAVARRG
jgi:hypothetical protein